MMSREEVYSKLAHHWWKIMHGVQSITMGKNGAMLVVEFKEDGSLDFPSAISFLPDVRVWRWNEDKQLIEILSKNGEILHQLFSPQWSGYYYILQDTVNPDTTYQCDPYLENIIKAKWAPDPILASWGLELQSSSSVCLISTSDPESKDLDKLFPNRGIENIPIIQEYLSFHFLREVYSLMLSHPSWINIAIVSPKFKKLLLPDLNYLDTELQIFFDTQSNIIGIVGCRSLLVELISESLLQYRLHDYRSNVSSIKSIVVTILNKHFNNRMMIFRM